MDATQFTGSDLYLKAEDLRGKTVNLTIKAVEVETFGSEEVKEHKLAIYFEGRDKGIVSNKTNTKRLIESFGSETDSWKGKKICASQNHTPLGIGFTLTAVIEDDFDDDIPF